MRRDFSTREELHTYLAAEFSEAAARDASMSPLAGGQQAAQTLLDEVDPPRYASSRNFLDGKVTRLSPYIRHGILSLARVRDFAFGRVKDRYQASKFITELAWRDYWQRLYSQWGNGIWEDREEPKTGFAAAAYQSEIPADVENATTGLRCMDSFVQELKSTGYLHNHARMWFAAYLVHWRRVRWQSGARFFLAHLLDGDPASNNLSWQWVASTFSHKPYFFNRENLEKYTGGSYCRQCPKAGRCDFEGSYESLADKLFRIEVPS